MLTRKFIDKEILSVAPPKDRSLKTKSRQKGIRWNPDNVKQKIFKEFFSNLMGKNWMIELEMMKSATF